MYSVRKTFEKEAKEMRGVYCATLMEMAEQNENVCVLDADLINSHGTKNFFKKYPERAFDCGIQENNMVGVAAGLSIVGMIPFAHTFAPFMARRCNDQIFMSCAYAGQNVRLIGSDPGVCAAFNGGTHMPFEDMGALMSIADITLVEPTDTAMMQWLTRELCEKKGTFYIRLLRKNPIGIFEEGSTFELGKAPVIRDGSDVCIAASGIMVAEALKAAEELEKEGISAAVINTFCWKPMDEETVVAYAEKCGCFVTAENHNIVGGLGSAVASVLAQHKPVPMEMVGVKNIFGQVGPENWLREYYGLTAAEVVKAAKKAISRK